MKTNVIKRIVAVVVFWCALTLNEAAAQFDYFEGPTMWMEEEPGWRLENGMIFYCADYDNREACLSTYAIYMDENPGGGGYYAGELIVPETITVDAGYEYEREYTVTGISGLFRNGVTILRLPETIRSLNSIIECRMLKEVYLNNSLSKIEGIIECPNLKVCPMPDALEYVGEASMSGLGLESIAFPPKLTSIGRKSFSRNYCLESISLGNLVETGDSCFNILPALKEVALPESLETLGKGSFSYCWGLQSVILPSHEISMEGCFHCCDNIREVTVNSETPYKCPSFIYSQDNVTIYVPDGSVDDYKNSSSWENFTILPISGKSGVAATSVESGKSISAKVLDGALHVVSHGRQNVIVADTSGKTHFSGIIDGRRCFNLPAGVYTVSANDNSVKVAIR